MQITIDCCLCDSKHKTEIKLPDGWLHRYGGIDDEQGGFCPDHAKVAVFAEAQCPGCVGGWGDCPMWRAFAHSHGRNITEADYTALESGVCPRRVNGTIGFKSGSVHDIDLSDRAPSEAGAAFVQAIKDYCARYPAKAA